MACRKDGKGRVLRKGEGYRKGDGRYSYVYIDPLGKKRTIYAKSLVKLREREEQLQKDQLDGLDVYVAGKADVNFCLTGTYQLKQNCAALLTVIICIHGIILFVIHLARRK